MQKNLISPKLNFKFNKKHAKKVKKMQKKSKKCAKMRFFFILNRKICFKSNKNPHKKPPREIKQNVKICLLVS